MMQQPTQEQAMSQQQAAAAAHQQMVLCPVRVVYETQILMPPGEQMNPNQTFYINPQNQPPWANQSPQIYPQNQMLYVQNMPQNIVPSVQQHLDPNQMYIQQTYPGMQQIIQSPNMPMLAQNLQDRQVLRQPVQFANVPQNMNVINVNQFGQMVNMQNVANIQQNVPNIVQAPNINQTNVQMVQQNQQTNSPKPPDVQQSVQNINFAQNIIQNQNIQRAQMVQQQFRIMQQQIVNAQQNAGNQTPPKVVQNAQPSQQNPVQMPNQIPPNPVPQQPQQHRMVVQQNVRQTFVQNVPQQTITQNQNMPNQIVNVQRNVASTYTQQQPNVYIRQTATVDPSQYNQTTVTNSQQFNQVRAVNNKVAIPNQTQQNTAPNIVNPPIRPRGPRPMATQTQVKIMPQNQQTRSMPQLRTMALQPNPMIQMQNMTAQMQKTQQKPICNVASQATNPPKPMQVSVATETMSRTPGGDNRKRKSESPDEAKHKIAAIEANKATYGNPNTYLVNRLKEVKSLVNEVGVNPESVHKAHIKISYPDTQGTPDDCIQTATFCRRPNATITSQDLIGEKLKRNTVFGQARVRNVSSENKAMEPMNELPNLPITAMEVVTDATIVKPEENKQEVKVIQPVKEAKKFNQVKIKEEPVTKTPKEEKKDVAIKTEVKPVVKPELRPEVKPEVKPEIKTDMKSDVKPEVKPVVKSIMVTEKIKEKKEEDKKPEKSEIKTDISPNALSEKIRNFSGKQIELSHGNIHKRDGNENNYILTHVLDGIVIQESNVAFPIRLPLKERIIPNAAVKAAETTAKVAEVPTKVLEVPGKLADTSTAELKQEITIKLKETQEEPSKSTDNNILTMSELHLDEAKKPEESEDSKPSETNENPLHCAKPQVVKSWTSEELASHLSKSGWHETASTLLEHEIDGESLFLVSTAQLLKIGIDENHATILSDFVSS